MVDVREEIGSLAAAAARHPEAAGGYAARIAALLRAQGPGIGPRPDEVYEPGRTLLVRSPVLQLQPIPPETDGTQPWEAGAALPVTVRVPFTGWILGVIGWAQPVVGRDDEGEPSLDSIPAASLVMTAEDGRDLFAVQWAHNGTTVYQGDGRDTLLLPASVCTGTRRSPRPLAWHVSARDRISVTFRNLTGTYWTGMTPPFPFEVPIRAYLAFLMTRDGDVTP